MAGKVRLLHRPPVARLIGNLAAGWTILTDRLGRWRIDVDPATLQIMMDGKPVVMALWHNRLMMAGRLWHRFLKEYRPTTGPRMAAMVSRSGDGRLVGYAFERLGLEPLLGSSGTQGRQAYRRSLEAIENGLSVALAVDGSRGPRHVMHKGAVKLAAKTGAPIVLLCIAAKRRWVLKTWDRFQIPRPGATGIYRLDPPVYVAADSTSEQLEDLRLRLQARLLTMNVETDRALGIEQTAP
ncbi:MAG: lysophospholipid acyltransferase family protein [Geminicoccaceae bacterium]